MKKLIYQLYYYSGIIVYYLFWGYFSIMMIIHYVFGKSIPPVLSYLFFLLLGMFLGIKLTNNAYDYLKKHQDKDLEK
ncbi:MAG: hypothetical protein EGQ20_03595 [Bacteroides oleiciplenus]|nr:hypothetical protein [Bacteroides oleiciplenus]